MTNRILLVLVGTLAVAPASAQTRAVPPKPAASGLSDQQKLEQAEAHLEWEGTHHWFCSRECLVSFVQTR